MATSHRNQSLAIVPARLAYAAAVVFIGASGAINLQYGWAKGGGDAVSGVIWASVAGSVAIIFALSWPALIRSLEARRWSVAAMALVALVITGIYSVTAALGSAAGGRMNASAVETTIAGAQQRAQDAYNRARGELAKLPAARPAAEVEALLSAAKPTCRIVVTNGKRDTVCVPNAPLTAELGRARQRERLQSAVDKASEMLNAGPAKVANSDAKALGRYLAAIGLNVTPDHLNDLLVLLAVLMIEAGGGLSLAVGMALTNACTIPTIQFTADPNTGTDNSCDAFPQPSNETSVMANDQKIKSIKLSTMRPSTKVYKRFAKLKSGMKVSSALKYVSRFDLAWAVKQGRVSIQ